VNRVTTQIKDKMHISCGNHVMPRFRSGTPDTAEPLYPTKIKKNENKKI